MSRFYYHPEINQSTILALSLEESLHLKTNRIQPETEILLSDGLGSLYSGIFKGFVSQLAQVEVVGKVKKEDNAYQLWIWQPLLKNWSRLEWLIEKLVEVGVSGIGIFYCERCVRERISSTKEERWRKIIIEAAKQSGRIRFPILKVITNWSDFLTHCRSNNLNTIIGDFSSSESISDYLKEQSSFSLQIIVGPEGDFSEGEKEQLHSLPKVCFLRFSNQILRSETAALYASIVSIASLESKHENCY
jgi:16S rRNA (uracil1498-N3)-methyltransferase